MMDEKVLQALTAPGDKVLAMIVAKKRIRTPGRRHLHGCPQRRRPCGNHRRRGH